MIKHKNDSKLNKIRSHRLVENGSLFNNKLEPLKWIHFFVGMTSYRLKGPYLKKGAWWASLYLVFLSIISMVYVNRGMSTHTSKEYSVTILKIAEVCMYISSSVHLVSNWMLNINSNKVISVLENFDYIEKALPKMNAFIYNSNNVNKIIHTIEIIYLCIFEILIDSNNFPLFQNCFTTICNIAMSFSVYQFCILVNMISSYKNVLNISICKFYNLPDYRFENINPIIYLLKRYIFQYASFDESNKVSITFIKAQNIHTFMKINNKLLNNLSLINGKFHVIVSNSVLSLYLLIS